ncbi:hypothetical protein TRFO_26137 [Tritrichomonas foetus]|uniref:C2 domain-containing protein n=1 Tax=Tritrichomonas foetus TaxID=1144522 RepID=A0A1J4K4Z0_9EUKA|nr:hypothetical protein TRFO_26137 [Tritrichomonas foetus]|eukprot:OHT05928.1 hypothetical protein TRFO_26137 [Tritrichomonas foetus]
MCAVRLHVTICSGSGLRAMDANGKSDPYVTVNLQSSKKKVFKTKVMKNSLDPVWNEEFDLICENPNDDKLVVNMYDQDPLSDDRMIDPIKISVSDIVAKIPEEFLFEEECVKTDKKDKVKAKKSGTLKFTVLASYVDEPEQPAEEQPAEERDVEIKEEKSSSSSSSSSHKKKEHSHSGDCVFSWGTYGSTYSTNFSGYTSGSFESLGELTPSSQTIHHHSAPTFNDDEVKPSSEHVVRGKLLSLNGLLKADDDGTDSYVTLQLFGKSALEKGKGEIIKTEVVHDTSDPEFNFEFEFDKKVRKGDSVELKVFQLHKILKDVCIGFCRIPIKELKADDDEPREYQLLRPKKFDLKGDFHDFGRARLVLHHFEKEFGAPQ